MGTHNGWETLCYCRATVQVYKEAVKVHEISKKEKQAAVKAFELVEAERRVGSRPRAHAAHALALVGRGTASRP